MRIEYWILLGISSALLCVSIVIWYLYQIKVRLLQEEMINLQKDREVLLQRMILMGEEIAMMEEIHRDMQLRLMQSSDASAFPEHPLVASNEVDVPQTAEA